MLSPIALFYALAALLPSTGLAAPVRYFPHSAQDTGQHTQQQLQLFHNAPLPMPQPHTSHHFDAAPNSVGMLFVTAEDEDEVVHVWLLLGKKVYTRKPQLPPLHF